MRRRDSFGVRLAWRLVARRSQSQSSLRADTRQQTDRRRNNTTTTVRRSHVDTCHQTGASTVPRGGGGLPLSSALSSFIPQDSSEDSARRHRPSIKSLRPTSAFRGANCTELIAGIMLATPGLATVPRATCEAQVNMVSLSGSMFFVRVAVELQPDPKGSYARRTIVSGP